jgi:hypothetical protein
VAGAVEHPPLVLMHMMLLGKLPPDSFQVDPTAALDFVKLLRGSTPRYFGEAVAKALSLENRLYLPELCAACPHPPRARELLALPHRPPRALQLPGRAWVLMLGAHVHARYRARATLCAFGCTPRAHPCPPAFCSRALCSLAPPRELPRSRGALARGPFLSLPVARGRMRPRAWTWDDDTCSGAALIRDLHHDSAFPPNLIPRVAREIHMRDSRGWRSIRPQWR